MRYLVRIAALAAVAVVVTACGSESDGQAQPEPSGSALASSAPSSAADSGQELPHSGAPAVTDPLPKRVLAGEPCTDALTSAQVKTFLGDAAASEDADSPKMGPGCRWSNQETLASFSLTYEIKGGQGLSAAYANAKPQRAFKEIDPVGGFPAVQYWDDSQEHNCNTVVGLADEYALVLSLTLGTNSAEEGDDPCEGGRLVMERVVGNLKAKA